MSKPQGPSGMNYLPMTPLFQMPISHNGPTAIIPIQPNVSIALPPRMPLLQPYPVSVAVVPNLGSFYSPVSVLQQNVQPFYSQSAVFCRPVIGPIPHMVTNEAIQPVTQNQPGVIIPNSIQQPLMHKEATSPKTDTAGESLQKFQPKSTVLEIIDPRTGKPIGLTRSRDPIPQPVCIPVIDNVRPVKKPIEIVDPTTGNKLDFINIGKTKEKHHSIKPETNWFGSPRTEIEIIDPKTGNQVIISSISRTDQPKEMMRKPIVITNPETGLEIDLPTKVQICSQPTPDISSGENKQEICDVKTEVNSEIANEVAYDADLEDVTEFVTADDSKVEVAIVKDSEIDTDVEIIEESEVDTDVKIIEESEVHTEVDTVKVSEVDAEIEIVEESEVHTEVEDISGEVRVDTESMIKNVVESAEDAAVISFSKNETVQEGRCSTFDEDKTDLVKENLNIESCKENDESVKVDEECNNDNKGGEISEGEIMNSASDEESHEQEDTKFAEDAGRKQYSKNFMLKIREGMRLVKPLLPKYDIVLSEPHRYQISKDIHEFDFRGLQGERNNGQNSKFEGRTYMRMKAVATLHKTENAWHGSKNKDETEALLCKLKSILNKITPQVFDILMEQIKSLQIDSEERLVGFISLLFDTCIDQPIFSSLYAKLAKNFSNLAVIDKDDETKTVTFRKLLLNKCQAEFAQEIQNEKEVEEMTAKIEKSQSEEEKKQLKLLKEEKMRKAKRNYLGTIRFIGELYKLSMLTDAIMLECLGKLLKGYEDEDNIECLCKLLTTIGTVLDKTKSKAKLDSYFATLDEMIKGKKTSARIRFTMMNVVELRKNKWVERMEEEKPKLIDEIHKKAETQNKNVAAVPVKMPWKQNSKLTGNVQTTIKVKADESEWTCVSKPTKLKETVNLSNFKLTKMDAPAKLGPSGSGWNKGVTQGKKVELVQTNRFSAFSNMLEEEENVSPQKQTVETFAPKPSTTKAVIGERMINDKSLEISREEMDRKVKSRIEEYLMMKDVQEAVETVKELKTDSCFKNSVRFFYSSIEQNMEKTPKIREEVGTLHLHVLKNRAAPVQAYAMALRKLARVADDLAVDVPQIWKYIGEIVSPVFLDGSTFKLDILIPESSLISEDSDDELDSDDNDYTARLLVEVLNVVAEKKNGDAAGELWNGSGLKWEAVVKGQTVDGFLKGFLKY